MQFGKFGSRSLSYIYRKMILSKGGTIQKVILNHLIPGVSPMDQLQHGLEVNESLIYIITCWMITHFGDDRWTYGGTFIITG